MENKQKYSIYLAMFICLFLLLESSCEKDDNIDPSSDKTNGRTTSIFNPAIAYDTMTDQSGNVYKTVTIGTQTWMAENLRTTKYNDGGIISKVTDNNEWEALSTGAYCNYKNTNSTEAIATYGRLYNWHAVNTGKLAPKGWHVPTDAEWTELTDYLGGEIGGKLKEIGTRHWESPNVGATNETGFTALPGGGRAYDGSFWGFGFGGFWWSATEGNANFSARQRNMVYDGSGVGRLEGRKLEGLSVRCVRD